MKFSTPKLGLTLAAILAAGLCALPAAAQTAAPAAASAPAAQAAPAPAMQPQPARPIPRKRRAAMPAAMGCEAVKDPWENLCTIRKHAEIACSDLPAPAAKAARKTRKGAPPPAEVRNPRQECIDAYMRNV